MTQVIFEPNSWRAEKLITFECSNFCGFYKNNSVGPCRLVGCNGEVHEVHWVRYEEPLA